MTDPFEERANKCLPGCYDPTGEECSKDYRCELHYRIAAELRAIYNEGLETAAKIVDGASCDCSYTNGHDSVCPSYRANVIEVIRSLAKEKEK